MDVVQRRTERWQARPLVRPQEALALGRARRARYIARVLGHQTLLKRLMCRCGLRRGRTSWQERQAKQTESDFDLHWTRKFTGDAFIITIISARIAKTFLPHEKRPKMAVSFSTVPFDQSFRSVTRALSKERCSAQSGSTGIRGIASTKTFLAAAAIAVR